MDFAKKTSILQALNTAELIASLKTLEADLEKRLLEQMQFSTQQHDFLAGSGQVCTAVKKILAELVPVAEGKNQAEKDAWLTRQSQSNDALNNAITKQREAAFVLEDHRVRIEMVKRRHDSVRALIALRTAQINFLAGSE